MVFGMGVTEWVAVFGILLSYGLIALLVCAIAYRVLKAAIRDGILEADERRAAKKKGES